MSLDKAINALVKNRKAILSKGYHPYFDFSIGETYFKVFINKMEIHRGEETKTYKIGKASKKKIMIYG